MDLRDAIQKRYSCRNYQNKAIDAKLLSSIIDTARNAPSASNRQEWRFVVVTDAAKVKAISDRAGDQGWWKNAPAIIACCAETDNHMMKCGQACYTVDLAIIMDEIALLATAEGLATCWLGAFDEAVVKEICGIPPAVRVVGLLTMGHAADKAREKSRKGVAEILFRDGWGKAF
jgi:nitroreductase